MVDPLLAVPDGLVFSYKKPVYPLGNLPDAIESVVFCHLLRQLALPGDVHLVPVRLVVNGTGPARVLRRNINLVNVGGGAPVREQKPLPGDGTVLCVESYARRSEQPVQRPVAPDDNLIFALAED